MNNRTIRIQRLPIAGDPRGLHGVAGDKGKPVLDVEVYYSEGGMNYFSGSSKPRGYYLSVTPRAVGENYTSTLAFSGICHMVEETKRFNARRLAELAAQGDKLPKYHECLSHVLDRQQLKLEHATASQPA